MVDPRAGHGSRLAADDKAGSVNRRRSGLGLALLEDLLDGDVRLILIQGGRVALDIEIEALELVDELLVVHLDPVSLQLLGDLMYALLGHSNLLPRGTNAA